MYKLTDVVKFRHFDSLTAMLAVCNNGQEREYSQSEATYEPEWYGSDTYDQANTLITEGFPEGVKAMNDAMTFAVAGMDSFEGKEPHMDVVGPVAITGAYCAGDPECMLTPADPFERPVVSLVVDCNQTASVSRNHCVRRGASILALAQKIEESGRSVAIYANCSSEIEGGKIHSYCVQVEKADADFNIHALSYVLTCPAFYRRHGFRLMELCSHYENCSSSVNMTSIEGIAAQMGNIDLYFPCTNTVTGFQSHFCDQESSNQYVLDVARKAGVIA